MSDYYPEDDDDDEESEYGALGPCDYIGGVANANPSYYLSADHPFDDELGEREGGEDIDWVSYEKCRGGCYRQFLYDGDHDCCGPCELIFCRGCAADSRGRLCSDCRSWWCGYCVSGSRCGNESGGFECPRCRDKKIKKAEAWKRNAKGYFIKLFGFYDRNRISFPMQVCSTLRPRDQSRDSELVRRLCELPDTLRRQVAQFL